MAETDWKEVSNMLRDAVRMAAWPVGIKMLPDAKSLHDFPNIKLLQKTAPCQMAARARYYREDGVVAASSRAIKCVWGGACLALIDTPERLKDGLLYLPYTDTMQAAQELHRSIGMMGDEGKKYGSMLMAPLDLMPVDPDAIVMYITPAQALRFIVAYLYETGKAIEQKITGQVSLCTSIAKVLNGSEFCVDVPCIGDRAYGVLQEQELVLTISPQIVDQLKIGLLGTKMLGSYPFKPFLNWSVILRPDMETMEFDF
jgi:uncharacterized protein (DUF169 family)